jgi:hypothetical protein
LSWHCFPPFDSSPKGEPLIGERIPQVADFPPLEAGGWNLTAPFRLIHTRHTEFTRLALEPDWRSSLTAKLMILFDVIESAEIS